MTNLKTVLTDHARKVDKCIQRMDNAAAELLGMSDGADLSRSELHAIFLMLIERLNFSKRRIELGLGMTGPATPDTRAPADESIMAADPPVELMITNAGIHSISRPRPTSRLLGTKQALYEQPETRPPAPPAPLPGDVDFIEE